MQARSCEQLASTESITLLVYQTDPFADVIVNWDSQAVQTCHVTSSANHVQLVAK